SYFGKSSSELESIIGYNTGALAKGYWFARLVEPINPGEFEFRGYTTFPGGIPDGKSATTHDALKSRLSGNAIDKASWQKMLLNAVERLNRKGADQVCKVIPIEKPKGYPVGDGIAQYEILPAFPKKFRIEAEVTGNGRVYRRPDDSIYVA
ncbi:MAG: hypothetical protein KDE08_17440, partial [Rhodobacteraceae bacterium]|nr:hypothetical protein [Paracoccaceae bacterium]